MIVHQASLWWRGLDELGNGPIEKHDLVWASEYIHVQKTFMMSYM